MITMKQARKEFGGRVMTAPAFTDADKKRHPRKNARYPKGSSFRAWARAQYGKHSATQLSPQLLRVLMSGGMVAGR